MTRLQRDFNQAVIVVLADESHDDQDKVIIVKVVEVWKGPDHPVGKTMNVRCNHRCPTFTTKERNVARAEIYTPGVEYEFGW